MHTSSGAGGTCVLTTVPTLLFSSVACAKHKAEIAQSTGVVAAGVDGTIHPHSL